jgi:RNA polymerase primary sigma factor
MSTAVMDFVSIQGHHADRGAIRKATELEPGLWEGFDPQQRRILSRLLRHSTEYVDHPAFHEAGAARTLFGGPRRSFFVSGSSLSPDAERTLFLRYNYARYREVCVLQSCRPGRISARKLSELLSWASRAIEARNEIVEPNMPLVLAMIRRNRMLSLDYNELISEGSLALLRCVDKFDCSRGNKFSTYACRSILKSFARVALRTSRHRSRFPFCFDPAMEKGNCSEQCHDEAESTCLEEVRSIMRDNRAVLSDVEMRVISARFLAEGRGTSGDVQTLEQIGNSIGVTKERVRQIQLRALRKLRVTLQESLMRQGRSNE